MIVYHLKIEQNQKIFHANSIQFPALNGYGQSEDEAALDFINKLNLELNRIIKSGEKFPHPLTEEQLAKNINNGKGVNAITLNASTSLSMFLHAAMKEKNVSRVELAKMMALKGEVQSENWTLANIRNIAPKRLPKNKQVQRLLDVTHHSTIREISEAFRVMDFSLDFFVRPNSFTERETILTI